MSQPMIPPPASMGITNEGARKTENRIRQVLQSTQQQLQQVQSITDEYTTLANTLETLPDKISHKIMVPFGPLAFFPGKLVHTNEVLVLLGQNYFVDQSIPKAIGIIERRKQHLEESKDKINEQIKSLESKLSITKQLSSTLLEQQGGGIVDIKEDYNSDEEKKKPTTTKPQQQKKPQQKKVLSQKEKEEDDDLFSRLMRMEEEEEERIAQDGLDYELPKDEDEENEGDEDNSDEGEEDEDDEEEEEEEEFDLQKEFEKMKLERQKRRENGESSETSNSFAPNTASDLEEYLRTKAAEPQVKGTKGKKVQFAGENQQPGQIPGVTMLPNVKPMAPKPFSGNIVERVVEPMQNAPEEEAPKKVSRFKAARMNQ